MIFKEKRQGTLFSIGEKSKSCQISGKIAVEFSQGILFDVMKNTYDRLKFYV